MHKNEKIVSFFRSCCPVMPYAVLCVLDAPRRSAYSMLSCALCCLMHPDGQHTRMSYAVLCTQTVSILYYAPWQVAWPSFYPYYLFLTIAFFPDYHFRSQLSNSIPFYHENLLLFVLCRLSASIPFGYTLLSLLYLKLCHGLVWDRQGLYPSNPSIQFYSNYFQLSHSILTIPVYLDYALLSRLSTELNKIFQLKVFVSKMTR